MSSSDHSSPGAATFSYDGFDVDGRRLRGRIQAPTLDDARRILRDQQILISAIAVHRIARSKREIRIRRATAKLTDVAWFARSLASAVEAGLPVALSLDVLGGQRRGTVIGDVIAALRRAVANGVSLPRAFVAHERVLGRVVVSLVEAGSESAALGPALAKAADILETQVNIRRKVVAALVYPAAVLGMAVLILVAMVLFVVPTFVPIFAELGSELPLPTRILLGVSAQARSLNGLVFVAVVVGLGRVLHVASKSRPGWRARRDRILFGLPLFGSLFEGSATARLCWTFSGLVEAGVAIQRAVVLAGEASGSAHYANAMVGVARNITNGRALGTSLIDADVFPPLMVNLAQMGERTARTDVMLARYAKDRELEVAAKVEGLTSLLEPILIGALGALVGLVVIALYAPLFGVIDKIR